MTDTWERISMKNFVYPESVVVAGVSDSPANLGRVIVENMDRFGFEREVYLVGRGKSLQGKQIFQSIDDVPGRPDLAILLVRAELIPETLEACGRRGIRHVVIETAGFSEFKKHRRGLEKKIETIAERWQMQLIGPNCIGILNFENGFVGAFLDFVKDRVKRGHVSMVSQSGGLVYNLYRRSSIENIGLNKLVSIGNKLMLGENTFLEFLVSDPGTKIITLYLESIVDGRRLMDIIESTDKPVIVLKANRTRAGRTIARFHTTALSGEDGISEVALRQCGAHRVDSIEDMVNLIKVFSLPLLKGPNLALMTRSGGLAVLLADAAVRHGLELARLPREFISFMREGSRAGVIRTTNPIDLGDTFQYEFFLRLVRKALETKGIDGVVFFHEYALHERDETEQFIVDVLDAVKEYQKPVAFGLSPDKDDVVRMKELCELPIFNAIDSTMKALYRSLQHHKTVTKRKAAGRRTVYGIENTSPAARNASARVLPPRETFILLESFGLPVAVSAVVRDVEEALAAAGRIGYPVALKIASPVVIHKTEQKGVVLNLTDPAALRDAMSAMQAEEYLIQKMAPPGYEVFAGAKRDHDFGPVVLFGSGGTLVELFKDVSMRIAPLSAETARQMVEETKTGTILGGYRGNVAGDKNALVRILIRLSRLLVEHPEIIDIDINPLIVYEKGAGCVIVDAKIRVIK
jgi:acetyltransferase